MNKKQKKNLLRILIAAALMVILHFVPAEGILRFTLYMIPYLIINGALCMVLSPPRLLFWDASVTSGRIMTILNAQWLLTGVAVLAASLTRRYSYDEEL